MKRLPRCGIPRRVRLKRIGGRTDEDFGAGALEPARPAAKAGARTYPTHRLRKA